MSVERSVPDTAQHPIEWRPGQELPLPVTPARRRVRLPQHVPGGRAWQALLLILVILASVMGGGLWYLDQQFAGKIYPNISVRGTRLDQLTRDEAVALLRAQYADFLQSPVLLTFGDQRWTPSAADLGITLDIEGAVDRAYASGRQQGLAANLQAVYAIWQDGLDLPLTVVVSTEQLQWYLLARAAELEQPAVDARLILTGLETRVEPIQLGRQVLVDETMQAIVAGIQQLVPREVAIQARDLQPLLDTAAASEAEATVRTLLQGPITLISGDQQIVVPPQELLEMMRIERTSSPEGDRILVELDHGPLAARISAFADATAVPYVNPRLEWNDGNLRIIEPGVSGARIDEARALELALDAAYSDAREVVLPMAEVLPPARPETLSQLGIVELVSEGRSDFTGSAEYRITNIVIGMTKFHGLLIAPGEEFSFNANVGSIDAQNGFVKGSAIIQNRVQEEFGGGICQDSTTMFRAAFWAGLPITERWGHSFYISWYDRYGYGPNGNGQGMDATIFTGGPDLRFVNDTGNWLLIQTFADPRSGLASVRLYGTSVEREVQMRARIYDERPAIAEPVYIADPKIAPGTERQTDTKRGGRTIDVVRIITYADGRVEEQLFRTVFRPWADKFLRNPADLTADGQPLPLDRYQQPAEQSVPPTATANG